MGKKFQTLLVVSIVLFYYLAFYLIATEIIQFLHHGPKEYLSSVFNYFDLISIILPSFVMSYMVHYSNWFGSVGETDLDLGLIVGISFSIFVLWIEFVSFYT